MLSCIVKPAHGPVCMSYVFMYVCKHICMYVFVAQQCDASAGGLLFWMMSARLFTARRVYCVSFAVTWPQPLPLSPRFLQQEQICPVCPIRVRSSSSAEMMAFIHRLLDWFRSLFWKEEMELTLVGLQYSGKTTFVNVIAVSLLSFLTVWTLLSCHCLLGWRTDALKPVYVSNALLCV